MNGVGRRQVGCNTTAHLPHAISLVSHFTRLLLLIIAIWPFSIANAEQLPGGESLWLAPAPKLPAVNLYFFWSSRCPHCQEARPFIESLTQDNPWIRVHYLEIRKHPENWIRFARLAETLGIQPQSVPSFMWCDQHHTGYQDEQTTGRFLLNSLRDCYQRHYAESTTVSPEPAR